MDPWIIGLIAVVVVGLAVILYGALSDRAKNRRRAEEMLAPPQRDIPQFTPAENKPRYLSELQARRSPDGADLDLSVGQRAEITSALQEPSTVTLPTGFLSDDFITDRPTGWAVLSRPFVLVCAEPVESFRELLGLLEKLIMSRIPLVLVAPEFAAEVRSTLEVNQLQHTMSLLAIAADDDVRTRVVELTGAEALSRTDLQSGYVLMKHLGRCDTWVSSNKLSYVIKPAVVRESGAQDPDHDSPSGS